MESWLVPGHALLELLELSLVEYMLAVEEEQHINVGCADIVLGLGPVAYYTPVFHIVVSGLCSVVVLTN